MNEEEAEKLLSGLEERVTKAEELAIRQYSELKKQLDNAGQQIAKLESSLQRYEALEKALKDVLSSGTIAMPVVNVEGGPFEIHDPVKPIGVKDPQEKLVAETTTIIGQVGECIIAGYITPKRLRVGEIEELLTTHFNGSWGKGQVQQALETLTAPPYRLFTHTVDSQKRHWFELRDGLKERVVKE